MVLQSSSRHCHSPLVLHKVTTMEAQSLGSGISVGTPEQPVEGQVTLMGYQMPWKPAALAT